MSLHSGDVAWPADAEEEKPIIDADPWVPIEEDEEEEEEEEEEENAEDNVETYNPLADFSEEDEIDDSENDNETKLSSEELSIIRRRLNTSERVSPVAPEEEVGDLYSDDDDDDKNNCEARHCDDHEEEKKTTGCFRCNNAFKTVMGGIGTAFTTVLDYIRESLTKHQKKMLVGCILAAIFKVKVDDLAQEERMGEGDGNGHINDTETPTDDDMASELSDISSTIVNSLVDAAVETLSSSNKE